MSLKKMFWWIIGSVVALFFVAFFVQRVQLWSIAPTLPEANVTPQAPAKIRVVTTLFPWYTLARAIGGDRVEVALVLAPGDDPHTFEPTEETFAAVDASDVFVYTGKSLEPWAADVARNGAEQTSVIDASEGVDLLPNQTPNSDEPDLVSDPHFWLDPILMKPVAEQVVQVLREKDPANAAAYRQRADAYEAQLQTVDEAYQKTLATCRIKTIVSGEHDAFEYLAKRYGLRVRVVSGASAAVVSLDPSENAIEDKTGRETSFFDRVESNLHMLKVSLYCNAL